MGSRPRLSLIVPTRRRPGQLTRFLDSLAAATASPESLEVVLVLDDDDATVEHPALRLVRAVGPAGRTMGQLNQAGYQASSGEFVMLLNDDVVVRTPDWDDHVEPWLRAFPDGIVLVHVNDTLMREHLCTFPLVSRTFCELAGGICPEEYQRYRIDDHLEEVFNLLVVAGERRIVHLPDVVFEHQNAVRMPDGHREYHADPTVLALDAPRFDALAGARKELALSLLAHIERHRLESRLAVRRRQLDAVIPPRHPSRLRVESHMIRTRPSITVGVLGRDRRCLDAVMAHTRGAKLIVLDESGPGAFNRLRAACGTDLLAVLTDEVRVKVGWLDDLLACLTPGVGLVTATEIPACDRLVFLLDHMRTRHLLAEESYAGDFHVLDFCRHVREMGLEVVCSAVGRALPLAPSEHLPPLARLGHRLASLGRRVGACYRRGGLAGLSRAAMRRIVPTDGKSL